MKTTKSNITRYLNEESDSEIEKLGDYIKERNNKEESENN
jgi:hypothetical protein